MSEGAPSKQLPKLVDPRKFAHQNKHLAGIVPEAGLPRLAKSNPDAGVAQPGCHASAELEFHVDEQYRKCVTGKVWAKVTVECQRCLEPLELDVQTEVNLAIVWKEDDSRQLPETLDPWIVSEEQGDLYAILEEELLLALPAVAYHDFQCIDSALMEAGDDTQASAEVESKPNPFDVLAQLKQTMKKDD